MKKICFQLFLAATFMTATVVTSCSSSNSNEAEAPSFPQEQTFNMEAGKDQTFSFNANTNWKLTSTAPWCKIVDHDMEVFDISGTAGAQTVTIRITDDGQTFSESQAELKLNMGGQERVIAKVVRAARTYQVQLLDAEGKELNELVVSNEQYTVFTVKTNFDFTTLPIEQLDFQKVVAGEGNKSLVSSVIIKESYLTHPISKEDNVKLEFYNTDGNVVASYPIIYNGIGQDFIKVKGVT